MVYTDELYTKGSRARPSVSPVADYPFFTKPVDQQATEKYMSLICVIGEFHLERWGDL